MAVDVTERHVIPGAEVQAAELEDHIAAEQHIALGAEARTAHREMRHQDRGRVRVQFAGKAFDLLRDDLLQQRVQLFRSARTMLFMTEQPRALEAKAPSPPATSRAAFECGARAHRARL